MLCDLIPALLALILITAIAQRGAHVHALARICHINSAVRRSMLKSTSVHVLLLCGVPRGSVAYWAQLYTAVLIGLIEKRGFCPHLYADDTQIMVVAVHQLYWTYSSVCRRALMRFTAGCSPTDSLSSLLNIVKTQLIYLFIHSFIHSFIHLFIYLFIISHQRSEN